MPKINRKYYVRVKRIANASINLTESICDLSSLITNTSLVLSILIIYCAVKETRII